MDTFCQSPVTTNTQVDNANPILTHERRNDSDALAETLKVLTIESTINNSAYYNSDKNDADSDPKSDPLVDTHTSDGKKRKVTNTDTTNGNSPKILLINRTFLVIISPIDPWLPGGIKTGRGTTHSCQTHALKVIVANTPCSGVRVFRTPGDVIQMGRDGTTPRGGNTSIRPPPGWTPQFWLVVVPPSPQI